MSSAVVTIICVPAGRMDQRNRCSTTENMPA